VADPHQINAVREFNRFYTSRLGMTRNGLHRTTHPLAEARVLYELGAHGVVETSTLRETLAIDAGQLSRLIKRLEEQGVLTRLASPRDARRQQVQLTPQGQTTFERLDEGSKHEVGALLESLPDPEGAIAAMGALRRAIDPDRTVTIRDRRPGDLGWLVERHGVLYAREYGWDESFERLVAGIVAQFDPTQDRAWIAETNGRRAGAVLCVHDTPQRAKLRTLLVEPHARGLGIGKQLVDEVIRHASARGYATLTLWTNDVLHAARHIYERAGFSLHSEAPHHAFGHDLTEQTWSLTLHPWTETH
jgi:DNA-binding MarR family transcriptional regulator/ribosomal protein S18 acetylase RimI-like enzyme